jgi:hypothetical protein
VAEYKNGVFSLFGKTSGCESEEQGSIPENTQNWEDNGGCLPALDVGGRRFEPCFSDKNGNTLKLESQVGLKWNFSFRK